MPAENAQYLMKYNVLSVTAEVTVGAEPAIGLATDLDGATSVNARGVVLNSRDGFVTISILGQVPVKVADGETIAKGDPVSVNAIGELISNAATLDVLGMALEGVTSASGDYIIVAVNPQPYVCLLYTSDAADE